MESKELKILMLEDLKDDAGLVEHALLNENLKFCSQRVDTREAFIEALDLFEPDIILSKYHLPQFNSFEALKLTKAKNPYTPFIFVTGVQTEELATNSMLLGADDYVPRANLSRLPVSIRYALKQMQNQVVRQQQEEALRLRNEALLKINDEMDSFVYSISHNLRSPLASVLGLVNLAKIDSAHPQSVPHYLHMIELSILQLDEILREILNYSQNTRTELNINPIDFKLLVENSFREMRHLKRSHTI
jgi:signal transduction histidine kinase